VDLLAEMYQPASAKGIICVRSKCLVVFTSHLQLSLSAHWIKSHPIYWNRLQKWLKQ